MDLLKTVRMFIRTVFCYTAERSMSATKKEFEQFYKDHLDKVYRYVFFRVGADKALAEDLVSEIFVKALHHFEKYDRTISVSSWIMTIAKNHLANHWRDTKKTECLPEDEDMEGKEGKSDDDFWLKIAKKELEQFHFTHEVEGLLAALTVEERELVTFHYLVGYSYAEVAELKNSTEGAIKVATHRALKKMRALL